MKNIAVIGCGMLGSRHLQSLAGLPDSYQIFAYDPFEESLKRARSIVEDSKNGGASIHYCSSYESLPDVLAVAIVATGADARADAVRRLAARSRVQYLILEKVLFQTADEYAEMQEFLPNIGAKAFVNCPRRLYRFYQDLRENMQGESIVRADVRGKTWGLACNGIHFIDLLAFLGRDKVVNMDPRQLQAGFLESKRKGFLEVEGTLRVSFQKGYELRLTSLEQGYSDLEIEIETDKSTWLIQESKGRAQRTAKNGGIVTEKPVEVLYQSQLSKPLVESLVGADACGLTSYKESAAMHLQYITTLNAHFNQYRSEVSDRCPIT